jgi:hypothetical protein
MNRQECDGSVIIHNTASDHNRTCARLPKLEHHADGFLRPRHAHAGASAFRDRLDRAFEERRSGEPERRPEPSRRNTGTKLMASSGIDPSG